MPPKDQEYCEVCGKPTSRLFRRIIDGAEMHVCYECKDFGDEPPDVRKKRITSTQQSNERKSAFSGVFPTTPKPSRSNTPPIKKTSKKQIDYETLKVKENAPKILLELRNHLGLTSDKFAESMNIKRNYYVRIERGETPMTLDMAKKIEQKYKIKLLDKEITEEETDDFQSYLKTKKTPTEGMVYFRKRGQAPEYDQDLTRH